MSKGDERERYRWSVGVGRRWGRVRGVGEYVAKEKEINERNNLFTVKEQKRDGQRKVKREVLELCDSNPSLVK